MSGSGSLDLGTINLPEREGFLRGGTVTGNRSFLRNFQRRNDVRRLTTQEARAEFSGNQGAGRGFVVQRDNIRQELSDSTTIRGSASDSLTISNTDTTIQNNLVSSATDDFMRSRNIQYVSSGFMDYSRVYLWMDGQQIFDVIPKL